MKHQEAVREFYRKQGREQMMSEIVAKFEELHEEYTRQGDCESADLVTDLVAWLQDDLEGMSDARAKHNLRRGLFANSKTDA